MKGSQLQAGFTEVDIVRLYPRVGQVELRIFQSSKAISKDGSRLVRSCRSAISAVIRIQTVADDDSDIARARRISCVLTTMGSFRNQIQAAVYYLLVSAVQR